MAYFVTDTVIGTQPIAETSATQKHPLGTIVRGKDPVLGEGEFIYLVGVANTDAGDVVSYDAAGHQTAIASIAAGIPRPLAVAMSDNVASSYGWYQIGGVAVINKASATAFAAGAALGVTSGLAVAASSTLRIANGVVSAAASGASAVTTVNVAINRPAGPSSD